MEKLEPNILVTIGEQLRSLRKKHYPLDSQDAFAFRIGVSKNTYISMEKGSGNVSFLAYIKAAELFKNEHQLLAIFAATGKPNLFDRMPSYDTKGLNTKS